MQTEAPAVRASRARVEAARAREAGVHHLDELELRVGDDYLDEHRVKVTARLPLRHPGEVAAERRVYTADAKLAETQVAEARLTGEADSCFPAVEFQARREERALFAAYELRQSELMEHARAGQRSGVVSEIDATRFELSQRVRLLKRQPLPLPDIDPDAPALPGLASPSAPLDQSEETLREAIDRHHPSIAMHRASAQRYEALADRARSRGRPWIKFVDIDYLYRSGEKNDNGPDDAAESGGGGKIAFSIPFGGAKAETRHYRALVRAQIGEAEARIEDQMLRGRMALEQLSAFEAHAEDLFDLLQLADDAEAVADRWWQTKRGGATEIASLFDEAFAARRAVLEAREEAGVARCTLLAMTGVTAEDWPRSGQTTDAIAAQPAAGNATDAVAAQPEADNAARAIPAQPRVGEADRSEADLP